LPSSGINNEQAISRLPSRASGSKKEFMPQIVFTCPVTDEDVPSGIETEQTSLDQMAPEEITLVCPHCGRPHTWQIRQGHLGNAFPEAR
jgi:hypothetical protein